MPGHMPTARAADADFPCLSPCLLYKYPSPNLKQATVDADACLPRQDLLFFARKKKKKYSSLKNEQTIFLTSSSSDAAAAAACLCLGRTVNDDRRLPPASPPGVRAFTSFFPLLGWSPPPLLSAGCREKVPLRVRKKARRGMMPAAAAPLFFSAPAASTSSNQSAYTTTTSSLSCPPSEPCGINRTNNGPGEREDV